MQDQNIKQEHKIRYKCLRQFLVILIQMYTITKRTMFIHDLFLVSLLKFKFLLGYIVSRRILHTISKQNISVNIHSIFYCSHYWAIRLKVAMGSPTSPSDDIKSEIKSHFHFQIMPIIGTVFSLLAVFWQVLSFF